MIIDAGGGTVDFSTYTFTQADPVELEEIIAPIGIFQGSALVRQRAYNHLEKKLLQSKFGEKIYLKSIAEEFDKTTKKRFKGTGDSYVKFSNMTSDKDPKVGIRNGQIKLTGEEVAGYFNPAVDGIVNTISDQRRLTGDSITAFLLVGGFAASDYLYSKLQSYLNSSGLNLFRPDAHLNKAVAEGALSFHIDHYVTSRVAKYTYGSKCSRSYEPANIDHKKRGARAYVSPHGKKMLDDGFQAVLLKGTKVTEETEFERKFQMMSRFGLERIECDVMCYRGNIAPEWTDEDPDLFSVLCNITADASKIPKKIHEGPRGNFYEQNYSVIISFGLTELKAHIAWLDKGAKRTGPASLIYDDVLVATVPT